jgi:hypothetical protein
MILIAFRLGARRKAPAAGMPPITLLPAPCSGAAQIRPHRQLWSCCDSMITFSATLASAATSP